jgi:pSer/pThr/pTyr-binding forkhead associated (FHA) protein
VAKLIIYRGDTLDREVDLGERNARIGRGDQNDIVLPDPAKSVSRFHAELRFEQGRFSIVDLNSQNGTWVAGRRVQQAALEPGIPVVLGTYRLVLKKETPPPSPVSGSTEATVVGRAVVAEPASAATMIVQKPAAPPAPPTPMPPPAPKAETPEPPKVGPRPEPKPEPAPASKVEAPPAPKAEPPKPAPKPEPPPVKVEPPKPAPRPEPPKPAPPAPAAAAKPAAAPKPAGKGVSKGLLFGGFAILVLAVMGAAVFLTPLKSQLASLTGGRSADSSAAAIPAGAPPAGDTAKPPEGQPSTAGAPPPATTTAAAPPRVEPSAPKPAATPARTVRGTGETGAAAAPRNRTASGAARRPAATPKAKPKPLDLSQTLEEARSAMVKGDYLAAIAGFESILKVDPKYPSAADLLGVARGGAKNASQLAVDSGNKAEMSGDYAGATKQYERALLLYPDLTAALDAMRRLKARMQSEGEDAFKRARQYDALGRAPDAISMYEKVLQLLPPDHANAKTAKERLAVLKGGL